MRSRDQSLALNKTATVASLVPIAALLPSAASCAAKVEWTYESPEADLHLTGLLEGNTHPGSEIEIIVLLNVFDVGLAHCSALRSSGGDV